MTRAADSNGHPQSAGRGRGFVIRARKIACSVSYGAADFENRQFGNTEPRKGIPQRRRAGHVRVAARNLVFGTRIMGCRPAEALTGRSGSEDRASAGGVDVLVEVEDVVWVVASLQFDEAFPVGAVRGANA